MSRYTVYVFTRTRTIAYNPCFNWCDCCSTAKPHIVRICASLILVEGYGIVSCPANFPSHWDSPATHDVWITFRSRGRLYARGSAYMIGTLADDRRLRLGILSMATHRIRPRFLPQIRGRVPKTKNVGWPVLQFLNSNGIISNKESHSGRTRQWNG